MAQHWLGPQAQGTPWEQPPLLTPFATLGGAGHVSQHSALGEMPPFTGAAGGVPPSGKGSMTSHHASPIGTGSAYTTDLARRQDAADARA